MEAPSSVVMSAQAEDLTTIATKILNEIKDGQPTNEPQKVGRSVFAVDYDVAYTPQKADGPPLDDGAIVVEIPRAPGLPP